MRIEQLEYVAAVAQHGSLRRASAQQHVSLPALSEAVTKLERELGVRILDRRRGGAQVSRRGRELLRYVDEVLESVDRLRVAATEEASSTRTVRVGTVSAATSTLLVPAVHELRARHPQATVEVSNQRQTEIHQGLLDGSLDLGLVNLLAGDDPHPELVGTGLLIGRPMAVLHAGHPLADRDEVSREELSREPLVGMREGYVMHRFARRYFGSAMPPVSYTCDGAELGKLMVAEGLGFTLLPDFSVIGDPLERAGAITMRPLAGDRADVRLEARRRPGGQVPQPVRDLLAGLVRQARPAR